MFQVSSHSFSACSVRSLEPSFVNRFGDACALTISIFSWFKKFYNLNKTIWHGVYCFYVSINLVCLWTYHSSMMHNEMVAWLFFWPGTSLFPQLLNFRSALHQKFVLQYKVNILTPSTLFDSRCIDCFFLKKSDCLSLGNRLVLILQASIAAGTLAENLVKALVTVWFCSCYPSSHIAVF